MQQQRFSGGGVPPAYQDILGGRPARKKPATARGCRCGFLKRNRQMGGESIFRLTRGVNVGPPVRFLVGPPSPLCRNGRDRVDSVDILVRLFTDSSEYATVRRLRFRCVVADGL